MIRFALVALALTAAAPMAHAQFRGPAQFEGWAVECNNERREFSLEAAERTCTAIIRSDSASSAARAVAYRQRGAVYLERGDRVRALSDFSDAIEDNPHSTIAYISRAAVYEAEGEYERAVADYDQVIRTAPDFGPAYGARCWLRTLAGSNLAMARADCDRAIKMGVRGSAYDSRGLLNLREENTEAAWADYDAAVSADRSAHALYGRGISALRLGRTEAGQADIADAVRLDAGIAATYQGYGVTP